MRKSLYGRAIRAFPHDGKGFLTAQRRQKKSEKGILRLKNKEETEQKQCQDALTTHRDTLRTDHIAARRTLFRAFVMSKYFTA